LRRLREWCRSAFPRFDPPAVRCRQFSPWPPGLADHLIELHPYIWPEEIESTFVLGGVGEPESWQTLGSISLGHRVLPDPVCGNVAPEPFEREVRGLGVFENGFGEIGGP